MRTTDIDVFVYRDDFAFRLIIDIMAHFRVQLEAIIFQNNAPIFFVLLFLFQSRINGTQACILKLTPSAFMPALNTSHVIC